MTDSILNITNYGFSFGAKVVLADINLSLDAQGITVLMGPVGVGKSSFLSSLVGINSKNPRYRQWGKAYLQGKAIDDQNQPILVKQRITQLNETVMSCILRESKFFTANIPERQVFVADKLTQFGIEPLLEMMQQRLVDIKPVWQRIALIAGAAAANPALLMVDEPTYSLDANDTALMLNFLRSLGQKMKLIVVLHSQQQARELADDVILLAGGRVQYHGDVKTFFDVDADSTGNVVKQFVRTGSVSVPSPDAKKSDLADDVEAPPPLPQEAIDAIQPFLDQAHEAVKVQAKAPEADSKPVNHIKVAVETEALKKAPPMTGSTMVETAPAPKLAALPLPSRDGVAIVARISQTPSTDPRAPAGFSWIVPDMLAGCPCPGVSAPMSYDLDLLATVGITVLITLTEEDLYQRELTEAGLRNVHLPIYDREAPSVRQMHMLLFRMQQLMESGEVLAVHCLAGLGRTGTVLAAWMIKEGGLSAAEAIRRLRLINPGFVQSAAQEEFLVEYENDILLRMQ